MKWFKNPYLLSAVGGAGAMALAALVGKAPRTRAFAVQALAKSLQLKQDAEAAYQNVKDEALDVVELARQEAQRAAAEADKRAAIEERVRALVEAELAATDAAAKDN